MLSTHGSGGSMLCFFAHKDSHLYQLKLKQHDVNRIGSELTIVHPVSFFLLSAHSFRSKVFCGGFINNLTKII